MEAMKKIRTLKLTSIKVKVPHIFGLIVNTKNDQTYWTKGPMFSNAIKLVSSDGTPLILPAWKLGRSTVAKNATRNHSNRRFESSGLPAVTVIQIEFAKNGLRPKLLMLWPKSRLPQNGGVDWSYSTMFVSKVTTCIWYCLPTGGNANRKFSFVLWNLIWKAYIMIQQCLHSFPFDGQSWRKMK